VLIRGRCHCGTISFALEWSPGSTQITGRECGCSFCTKHGGVWTSFPNGKLDIEIQDSTLVSHYSFGTKTADFHVCARCGVVPLVTSRIEGRVYAVVNVDALEGIDHSMIKRVGATFAEEDDATRLARRKRNWIGHVEYVETPERWDLR
jgi:hypothetical protein